MCIEHNKEKVETPIEICSNRKNKCFFFIPGPGNDNQKGEGGLMLLLEIHFKSNQIINFSAVNIITN